MLHGFAILLVATPLQFAAPSPVAALRDAPAPPPATSSLDVEGDVTDRDGTACVAYAQSVVLRACAATDATDPTTPLWPELTGAVALQRGPVEVAFMLVDRAALDDDDVAAWAVLTFAF